MNDDTLARDVTVRGVVQGVAFRWTTLARAQELGVAGWVRNDTDGSVQAHLEGAPDAVSDLIDWMRQGPSGAYVEELDDQHAESLGHRRFEVR